MILQRNAAVSLTRSSFRAATPAPRNQSCVIVDSGIGIDLIEGEFKVLDLVHGPRQAGRESQADLPEIDGQGNDVGATPRRNSLAC